MAAVAVADYSPPPFFVLAGRSDLIVVGTIVKVSPRTFTLRVEEVLAGFERSEEIEVARFELQIPPGNQAGVFWENAQTRLETVICYCSIYEECWQVATRAEETVAVRACRHEPARAFGR